MTQDTRDNVYLVTATPGGAEHTAASARVEDVQKNIDLKNSIIKLAAEEGTTIYIHEYNSGRRKLGVLVECPEEFLSKIQALPHFHASKETNAEKTYRHRGYNKPSTGTAPKKSVQRKPS